MLDIAPEPKERPRFSRKGFAYTAKTTRDFEAKLSQAYKEVNVPPLEGPLKVTVVLYLDRPKAAKNRLFPMVRPDLDNYVKAVLDAADGILWKDDGQVVILHAMKFYGPPKIVLIIEEATKEDQASVGHAVDHLLGLSEGPLDASSDASDAKLASAQKYKH